MTHQIKTWQERVEHGSSIYAKASALECEIAELRAALAEREALITEYLSIAKDSVHEITTLRTAAQQALEALEELRYSSTTFKADKMYAEAKATLTAALESKT